MSTALHPSPSVNPETVEQRPGRTDGELLAQFSEDHDETAFATLVERYAPLVLGVCRRVLGHAQDAEDAFQAAFLVLARKAGSIRRRQSVGGWLFKVAYRTALRARALQAHRKQREQYVLARRPAPDPSVPPDADVRELVDDEVRRLPEKYRTPVLLCYLQGRTNEEAARQLHCPTGTLKVRLLRARELLRKRLSRRGIALSVAALLGLWAEAARAAVRGPLVTATAQAASRAGAGLPGSGLSSGVRLLAERVLKGMVLTKVKVAFAVLLTVLLLACADGLTQRARGAGLSGPGLPARPSAPPRPAPKLDAPPQTIGAPELLAERTPAGRAAEPLVPSTVPDNRWPGDDSRVE